MVGMTKLLEEAMTVARSLPTDVQDDIARAVLTLAAEVEPIALSLEEKAAITRSREAAARGEFATDEQVRAVWAKYSS
jgi:hypothetical protein